MPTEPDDSIEELLEDDDAPSQPAAAGPTPPAPLEGGRTVEAEEGKAPPAKVSEEPRQAPKAPAAPPRKRSAWPTITVIILVLLAVVVGLGWYANELRGQVAELKGELESVKTQATGAEATASKVVDGLVPLVEEHVAVAKLRAAAGDTEGAKYSLMLAKRYADMADRLSSGSPPSKLRDLTAQIEETEKGLGGGAAAGGTGTATTGAGTVTETAPAPPEGATTPEQPPTKAQEAPPQPSVEPAAPGTGAEAPAQPTTPEAAAPSVGTQ